VQSNVAIGGVIVIYWISVMLMWLIHRIADIDHQNRTNEYLSQFDSEERLEQYLSQQTEQADICVLEEAEEVVSYKGV
jgi:2-phosphoglycerate kinase